MVKHKRGLSGAQVSAAGGVGGGEGSGRDNTEHAVFWVSHRQGPFLVHEVGGCKPEGNVGFGDNYDNLIEQGFAPCPQCIGGAA